jgi:predicted acetyltransferase
MLAESFARMARRGEVIAALYPTASALYRGAGFEVVAFFGRRSVPLAAVAAGREQLAWRPIALDDPVKGQLHDRASTAHDGWFRSDPAWWAHRGRSEVRDANTNRFAYVGSRDGVDVSVVQFRYQASEAAMYDLDVEVLAGLDGAAVGAALGLLAAHGSTAGAIRTALPPVLLGPHVPELQRTRVLEDWPLMLRLVDAPAAFAARGWPRAVQGRVDLDIVDDALAANAGPHVLDVAGGEGALLRGGTGRITVTAQDLAVLYAGGDVQALRSAGHLAEATADDLDLLVAACASRPTCPLFF